MGSVCAQMMPSTSCAFGSTTNSAKGLARKASDTSLLRAKALPEDLPIVQAVALMAQQRHEFSILTTAEGAGELR